MPSSSAQFSDKVCADLRDGRISISDAKKHEDTNYATTLHVINSAVVKISKLTKATTVYRGISLAGGQLSLRNFGKATGTAWPVELRRRSSRPRSTVR